MGTSSGRPVASSREHHLIWVEHLPMDQYIARLAVAPADVHEAYGNGFTTVPGQHMYSAVVTVCGFSGRVTTTQVEDFAQAEGLRHLELEEYLSFGLCTDVWKRRPIITLGKYAVTARGAIVYPHLTYFRSAARKPSPQLLVLHEDIKKGWRDNVHFAFKESGIT
jgi:hypothetical protein